MRIIVLAIMVLGFAVMPPGHRLMSVADDDDYLAVATSIAYGKFPYFSDEYHVGERMPFASVGPGVLASPFVFMFSTIDRLEQAPITIKREKGNRYWTWTLLGFHYAVYFYFLLGAALFYEALKLWVSPFAAIVTTLSTIAGGGGILIYAFRRPVMSHVFEFFTVSAAILLVSLAIKGRRFAFHRELVGFCAAMIFLTRYNNIFLACGVMAIYLWIIQRNEKQFLIPNLARIIAAFMMPIFVFRVLPVLANGYSQADQGYRGAASHLWPVLDPLFYVNRLTEILLAPDMGLIYTAPVLLVAVWAFWKYRSALPTEIFALAALSVFNLYIAIVWRTFGAFYGYRYLVFTALPLLAIYLATWIDDIANRFGRRAVVAGSIAICLFPLASVLVFERYERYDFIRVVSYGIDTYSRPNYHTELVKDLLHNPIATVGDAVTSSWQDGFLGMTPEQIVQRASLYLVPPLLFLLCCTIARRRSLIPRRSPHDPCCT